jgi:uncharacterized protein
MLIIKITNFSEGSHKLIFDEPLSIVGLAAPFNGNFTANVDLHKSHNQIILNTELALNANFECDRCTKNYSQLLKTKYQMVYFFGEEEVETEAFNTSYLPLDADKIDIGKDVKEFAILAIPMKKLCREDCSGLCYKCGKDLNDGECNCSTETVDARWLPLLELKNKLSNN